MPRKDRNSPWMKKPRPPSYGLPWLFVPGRTRAGHRYTFDRFVRIMAQHPELLTVLIDQQKPRTNMYPVPPPTEQHRRLILDLASDPSLPIGIKKRPDLDGHICTPGSSEQARGDWSKPAWTEVWLGQRPPIGGPTMVDELWEMYLLWRRTIKAARYEEWRRRSAERRRASDTQAAAQPLRTQGLAPPDDTGDAAG